MSLWDARYLGADYAFGTEPQAFLREVAPRLPAGGPALDLASGEGRNAVFLAERGHTVTGVDLSAVGLAKAQALAAARGVNITTVQADLGEWQPPAEHYAVVSCIWLHLPAELRRQVLPRMAAALRPGGAFVGVFYHPQQLALGTGGPSDPALLATLPELQADLPGLTWAVAEHRQVDLAEGSRHCGPSSVLYLLGFRAA